jgi:hypothetical protein
VPAPTSPAAPTTPTAVSPTSPTETTPAAPTDQPTDGTAGTSSDGQTDRQTDAPTDAPPDVSDQGIAATLGIAAGGRTTPGGLAIGGHYLYQMSAQDWFDGTATFTFGSGAAACFRDRMDDIVCQHGFVDGTKAEIAANVRHYLGGREEFWPYVRLGAGIAIVRYGDDDLTGIALPLHGGAGVRVSVADGVAVIAEAALELGIARFSRGLGVEPQLGASVMAGAEFRL